MKITTTPNDMHPRLQVTLFSALVFIIISSFGVYNITNKYLAKPLGFKFITEDGFPTRLGISVHTIVAGSLMYAYMVTFDF